MSNDVMNTPSEPPLSLPDLQRLIREMYQHKDEARGLDGTFLWFLAEVGELAASLRGGTHEERVGEFADVLAWLTTLANIAGVDLREAIQHKYGGGCPGCRRYHCTCPMTGKP